jgi:hypothetical protein
VDVEVTRANKHSLAGLPVDAIVPARGAPQMRRLPLAH